MAKQNKPTKKTDVKPSEEEEDDDENTVAPKSKKYDDEDDDFDGPLDDLGGFEDVGYDDDDDF